MRNKNFFLLVCVATVWQIFAAQRSQPTFEIENKAGSSIWIAVVDGNGKVVKPLEEAISYSVPLLGTVAYNKPQGYIDIDKKNYLVVWRAKPKDTLVKNADHAYTFTRGKTIYVTWSKENVPQPQTGILVKVTPKEKVRVTKSNLPLSNNVEGKDIELIDIKQAIEQATEEEKRKSKRKAS